MAVKSHKGPSAERPTTKPIGSSLVTSWHPRHIESGQSRVEVIAIEGTELESVWTHEALRQVIRVLLVMSKSEDVRIWANLVSAQTSTTTE